MFNKTDVNRLLKMNESILFIVSTIFAVSYLSSIEGNPLYQQTDTINLSKKVDKLFIANLVRYIRRSLVNSPLWTGDACDFLNLRND